MSYITNAKAYTEKKMNNLMIRALKKFFFSGILF
jgi:hypothetical protein